MTLYLVKLHNMMWTKPWRHHFNNTTPFIRHLIIETPEVIAGQPPGQSQTKKSKISHPPSYALRLLYNSWGLYVIGRPVQRLERIERLSFISKTRYICWKTSGILVPGISDILKIVRISERYLLEACHRGSRSIGYCHRASNQSTVFLAAAKTCANLTLARIERTLALSQAPISCMVPSGPPEDTGFKSWERLCHRIVVFNKFTVEDVERSAPQTACEGMLSRFVLFFLA